MATRLYPIRLYVVMRKLSAHAKADDQYLFAYSQPPDDTPDGELVGVYDLASVMRQVVERKLVPLSNTGKDGS